MPCWANKLLGALSHAAGDNHICASFGQPGRQKTWFMRRRGNVLTLDYFFCFRIHVDHGKACAVTKMHGQLSFG
ncbi:MAG: hypothetical protein MZV70_25085 [Desulfobacterales bacterium]|nr:hypothetical protein [Desulfobacterales bacterium]